MNGCSERAWLSPKQTLCFVFVSILFVINWLQSLTLLSKFTLWVLLLQFVLSWQKWLKELLRLMPWSCCGVISVHPPTHAQCSRTGFAPFFVDSTLQTLCSLQPVFVACLAFVLFVRFIFAFIVSLLFLPHNYILKPEKLVTQSQNRPKMLSPLTLVTLYFSGDWRWRRWRRWLSDPPWRKRRKHAFEH